MARTNDYRAQDFIDVIPGSGGIISTIAERVGCTWSTAKRYIKNYPTVQQAYEDERESVVDDAESVVISAINDGDTQTAKWYLGTIGKDRGYSQRQEITGDSGGPVTIKVIYDD